MQGYSLSWLRREQEELLRDRHAFASALDILKRRISESNKTDVQRTPLLHEWSGSRASVGSLEMALHAVERTINEIGQVILSIENGEALDTDVSSIKKEHSGAN